MIEIGFKEYLSRKANIPEDTAFLDCNKVTIDTDDGVIELIKPVVVSCTIMGHKLYQISDNRIKQGVKNELKNELP